MERERERGGKRFEAFVIKLGRLDKCKYSHPKAITNITAIALRGGNIIT